MDAANAAVRRPRPTYKFETPQENAAPSEQTNGRKLSFGETPPAPYPSVPHPEESPPKRQKVAPTFLDVNNFLPNSSVVPPVQLPEPNSVRPTFLSYTPRFPGNVPTPPALTPHTVGIQISEALGLPENTPKASVATRASEHQRNAFQVDAKKDTAGLEAIQGWALRDYAQEIQPGPAQPVKELSSQQAAFPSAISVPGDSYAKDIQPASVQPMRELSSQPGMYSAAISMPSDSYAQEIQAAPVQPMAKELPAQSAMFSAAVPMPSNSYAQEIQPGSIQPMRELSSQPITFSSGIPVSHGSYSQEIQPVHAQPVPSQAVTFSAIIPIPVDSYSQEIQTAPVQTLKEPSSPPGALSAAISGPDDSYPQEIQHAPPQPVRDFSSQPGLYSSANPVPNDSTSAAAVRSGESLKGSIPVNEPCGAVERSYPVSFENDLIGGAGNDPKVHHRNKPNMTIGMANANRDELSSSATPSGLNSLATPSSGEDNGLPAGSINNQRLNTTISPTGQCSWPSWNTLVNTDRDLGHVPITPFLNMDAVGSASDLAGTGYALPSPTNAGLLPLTSRGFGLDTLLSTRSSAHPQADESQYGRRPFENVADQTHGVDPRRPFS